MQRLDGIGIEVGRYRGEIHQSCRKTFIKVLMDSLTKVRDRKSILHIAIECTMSFMARNEFVRDLDSRFLEIYLSLRTICHYYRYFIVVLIIKRPDLQAASSLIPRTFRDTVLNYNCLPVHFKTPAIRYNFIENYYY